MFEREVHGAFLELARAIALEQVLNGRLVVIENHGQVRLGTRSG